MTDPHLEHSIFGGHEDAHEQPARDDRRDPQPSGPPPPPRADRAAGGRRLGCLFVALAIVAVAAFAAYTVLRPVVDGFLESDDYPGPGTGEVQVVVNDGDTGRAIGATLQKADVVKTRQGLPRRGRGRHAGGRDPAGQLHDEEADDRQGRARHPRGPREPQRPPGHGA